ncbi:MAG: Stk1 family PASTA domain-containing Ser/Thr kinase [Clostridia bacterium]|nr:Stk1 family PASTA domain-containing Ser/Thr kinase [Clostridia bacterium]
MMNLIGKMLDNRYEILEKIGNGGMATVFKAKCHVLNRFVAVKILRDEFTTDSEFIKRFNSEAQSAASLTHPNIVSIYDVGNEDNLYYIVMELIQGKTLKEIINEDGKLPWKWSVNIAIQIASALETAHKNNIIHRDIKPHNIIITEDGMAKVTDFGIAKAVSNSTITAFGTTIGSVHYFSPEHARGGYTDAKSDLYSLGVVMYEMLTGKVPFDADTPVSVALKQVQEEPVDPITYNDTIPISVNRIILKSMQKDPSLRYQNATDMIKDLTMALKRPNEDFVVLALRNDDSPTQKVPTIYQLEMEKNNDRNAPKIGEESHEENKKKKNKVLEFFSKHKFIRALLILAILGMIFIGVAFGVMRGIKKSVPADGRIPQLVFEEADKMLTEEQAIEKLKEAGFTDYEILRETSDTVEAGFVIKQEPNDSITHKVTTRVTITVSSGPEIVTLPTNMVGKQIDEVTEELKKLGLPDPTITYETSETSEKGMILKIEPDGSEGEQVVKSTVLSFVVSSGSQYADVEVISVVGDTEDVAVSKLEASNLVVDVEYDYDSSKSDGIVLSQDIKAGKVIKESDTITLTVNKWPASNSVKFKINVASYYPDPEPEVSNVETASNTTENTTTNTSSTSTSSSKQKNVSVVINIDNRDEKTISISTSENNYEYESLQYSGYREVIISIGGSIVYKEKIDFSQANQVIEISKK